jgi:hypothetical protein
MPQVVNRIDVIGDPDHSTSLQSATEHAAAANASAAPSSPVAPELVTELIPAHDHVGTASDWFL